MNAAYPHRTSSLAIVSLIFGILGWVMLPGVGAIVAVICGHMARAEIRREPPGTVEGDGMAIAGLILGWVSIVLGIVMIAIFVLFMAGLAIYGGSH